jgi:hypothetical protein
MAYRFDYKKILAITHSDKKETSIMLPLEKLQNTSSSDKSNNIETTEYSKEMILSYYDTSWQNVLRLTRMIIKNILPDSLILMIVEYHIDNRKINDIFTGADIYESKSIKFLNQCDYCQHYSSNLWISIHCYIKASVGYLHSIYRSQLSCSSCLTLEYSNNRNTNHIRCFRGEDPIWVNVNTGKPEIDNWKRQLQVGYDDNDFPYPVNNIAKLRFHSIDETCRLFPISKFNIEHEGHYIAITFRNIDKLFE